MFKMLWQAVVMTLRGQRPIRPYGKLIDWIATTDQLSTAALSQADAHGLSTSARQGITAKIDGRVQSLETVLKTVQYHAQTEFRYLLQDPTEHALTAIYAINLNDSYALGKLLAEHDISPAPARSVLEVLAAHLNGIPPSTDLSD